MAARSGVRNDVQVRSNKEAVGVQPVGRIYEDVFASMSADLRWCPHSMKKMPRRRGGGTGLRLQSGTCNWKV